MNAVKEIDLSPKPGKTYWKNCHREWREEFIYFLLVDRFHDSNKRRPLEFEIRHYGFGEEKDLQKSCGGALRGIINHLAYIKNLGCTAIWTAKNGDKKCFLRIYLRPMQFVVLQNS